MAKEEESRKEAVGAVSQDMIVLQSLFAGENTSGDGWCDGRASA